MKTHISRLVYWSPRILGILYAGFITMFAADAFEGHTGFWEKALALVMHLIPTAMILLVLAVGWHWDLAGAVGFFLLGLLYAVNFPHHWDWIGIIAGPTFVIGLLFLANWLGRRRITQ